MERSRPFGCLTLIGIFLVLLGVINYQESEERYKEWSTAPRVLAAVVEIVAVPRGTNTRVYRHSVRYQLDGESRSGYIERSSPIFREQIEIRVYQDGDIEEIDRPWESENPYAFYQMWNVSTAIGVLLILIPIFGALLSIKWIRGWKLPKAEQIRELMWRGGFALRAILLGVVAGGILEVILGAFVGFVLPFHLSESAEPPFQIWTIRLASQLICGYVAGLYAKRFYLGISLLASGGLSLSEPVLLRLLGWSEQADHARFMFGLACAAYGSYLAVSYARQRREEAQLPGLLPLAAGALVFAVLRSTSYAHSIEFLFPSVGTLTCLLIAGYVIGRLAPATPRRHAVAFGLGVIAIQFQHLFLTGLALEKGYRFIASELDLNAWGSFISTVLAVPALMLGAGAGTNGGLERRLLVRRQLASWVVFSSVALPWFTLWRTGIGLSVGAVGILRIVLFTLGFGLAGAGIRFLEESKLQSLRDTEASRILEALRRGERSERPFILYLRPFYLTGQMLRPNPRRPALPVVTEQFSEPEKTELETEMAREIESFAVLLGLGRPGEHLGAGRIGTSEESWKQEIEFLAKSAAAIVAVPSARPGTFWEITWLKASALFGQCIFVMPPKSVGSSIPLEEAWEEAREALLKEDLQLPLYDSEGCLFLLGEDGKPYGQHTFDMAAFGSLARRMISA